MSEFQEKYKGVLFGAEMEFFIVDSDLNPVDIQAEFEKLQEYGSLITKELPKAQIEIKTYPTGDLLKIKKQLRELGKKIVKVVEENNAFLLPAALHPTVSEFELSEGYDRFTEVLGYYGILNGPRVTSSQINVGAKNEKQAIEIHNLLRKYLPYLMGFAVASPVLDGEVRKESLCERLPVYDATMARHQDMTGFPKVFSSLEDYLEGVKKLSAFNAKFSYNKYIRPRPDRGVAGEIRSLDSQPTVEDYMSLVAFTKGLILAYYFEKDIPDIPERDLVKRFYQATREGIYNKEEFKKSLDLAKKYLNGSESKLLAPLYNRIENGTVAENIVQEISQKKSIKEVYLNLAKNLMESLK